MTTDLTFITNEHNHSLKDRFEVLIKNTALFDCLVGYFYISGFHALYKSLEKTEKIRILIGINTNRQTYNLLAEASQPKQQVIEFSHAETKEEVEKLIEQEFTDSEDNKNVEDGAQKFIEWVRAGKLTINLIKNLPIRDISLAEQQPFEALVDHILAAKQRDPAADTRAPEAEIDRLVYALYGLTAEEIALVEGQV